MTEDQEDLPSTDLSLLARRAQAGDQAAFEALFERLHQPVLNYAYHMLQDRPAAEDVAQEAFIRAHAQIGQLGPPWDFKSWIFRIASNLAMDHFRRNRRFVDLEEPYLVSEPPTTRRPAERAAQQAAQREEVWRTLEELPTVYRQALILRELNGLSYQEMARAMEVSYDNARQLVHRARNRFRQAHGFRMVVAEASQRCRELAELLSARVDGELDEAARREVEAHLRTCRHCQQTEEEMKKVAAVLALLPPLPAEAAWKAQVLEKLRARPPGSAAQATVVARPRVPAGPEEPVAAQGGAGGGGGVGGGGAGLPFLGGGLPWVLALAGAAGLALLLIGGALALGRLRPAGPPPTGTALALAPPLPSATEAAPAVAPLPVTPSATASLTPSPSPTLTPTPTPTPTLGPPRVTANQNSNCRAGPGTVYEVVGFLLQGQTAPVEGKNAAGTWWWIVRQDGPGHCYIWDGLVTREGDFSGVPVVPDPPTPTPADTQPPQVSASHAPTGASRPNTKDPVTITATASDDRGVAEIEIWVQAPGENQPSLVQTCTGTTTCVFKGGPYPAGSLTYFARARDQAGNEGESPPVEITIYLALN